MFVKQWTKDGSNRQNRNIGFHKDQKSCQGRSGLYFTFKIGFAIQSTLHPMNESIDPTGILDQLNEGPNDEGQHNGSRVALTLKNVYECGNGCDATGDWRLPRRPSSWLHWASR